MTALIIAGIWACAAVALVRILGPAFRHADAPCRCGHSADAHEHYRKGTDCALCDCAEREPDLLADLPAEVLSQAEVDRRVEQMESQWRHPSSRTWWA